MPGISRLEATMSLADRHTTIGPLSILHQLSQTEWIGPNTIRIATAVTEESLVVLLTQGLTTITALLITANENITVTYGAAASNAPVALNANGFHAMSGTSLTALAVTTTVNPTDITYWVAGS